jgi:hypothetical protein
MEYLMNHAWNATFLPSVYPAKALVILMVEYEAPDAAHPVDCATHGA